MATVRGARGMEAALREAAAPDTPSGRRTAGEPRKPWAIALSAVVPGLGSLAVRRIGVGAWILGVWLIALATLAISRDDVSRTLADGETGDWIALFTLLATLVGV